MRMRRLPLLTVRMRRADGADAPHLERGNLALELSLGLVGLRQCLAVLAARIPQLRVRAAQLRLQRLHALLQVAGLGLRRVQVHLRLPLAALAPRALHGVVVALQRLVLVAQRRHLHLDRAPLDLHCALLSLAGLPLEARCFRSLARGGLPSSRCRCVQQCAAGCGSRRSRRLSGQPVHRTQQPVLCACGVRPRGAHRAPA